MKMNAFTRSSRFWTFQLLIGLSLVGTLAGSCTRGNGEVEKGILHVWHRDDVKSFDPATAYDGISLDVAPSILESLFQYEYLNDTHHVVPLIASDMPTFSKNRLTLTIRIRPGIHFQDDPCFKETQGKGREVTAHDFIYAFKRLALPSIQSQGWWIFDGKVVGINKFHDRLTNSTKKDIPLVFDEPIEGLKALDNHTLQIKLTKPYPQLLYILAMTFTAPVPYEAVRMYGDENGNITNNPVGTGPFRLKSWQRGRKVVLEKNPNYHAEFYPTDGAVQFRKNGFMNDAGKQIPFLDQVVAEVIKEQQPAWLNFMKSKIDILLLPKDNYAQAITNNTNLSPELASKGIRLNIETGTTFWYISFNMKDKLLGSNKYLRQAISSAINRENWIETFTNGTGRKAVTVLPPGTPDRPAHSQIKYDFDIKRAKELLKKAGYPGGQGLPVINFDLRGADTLSRQLGDFFTHQLDVIGVKLNVILNTFPAYLEKAKQGNLAMSYAGWQMDYPDAENAYQLLYGPNKAPGPNDSNFDHPLMNKLYDQMAILESGKARSEIIKKMDEILQEDCPWALGYYMASYELVQPWVQNYRIADLIQNKYKFIRINKEVKKRYLGLR